MVLNYLRTRWLTSTFRLLLSINLAACSTIVAEPPLPPTYTPIAANTLIATHTNTPTIAPLPTLPSSETPIPTPTLTPTPLFLVGQDTPLPISLPPITLENANQLSALAEWRETAVSDLAWTPDSYNLAISDYKNIYLYDVLTRQNLRTLYPTNQDIIDIAFNPLGNWFVAGSRRGSLEEGYASSLELWYGPDWKPLGLLYGAPRGLSQMAFSPSGFFLATVFSSPVSQLNSVEFFNTFSWTISGTLETGPVLNTAFSTDGSLLAGSPGRYAITLWDLKEKKLLYTIPTSFTGAVNYILFSPDGTTFASGHYDGMVRFWDVQSGELLYEFTTGAVVQSMAFSPDGRILATGGSFEEGRIQLWSAASGQLLRSLDGDANGISVLAFSPDSRYLASASYVGIVRIWGIRP